MIEVEIITHWLDLDGYRIGYASQTYPGAWTHSGQQADENVVPDPNVTMFHGLVDEETLIALEADEQIVILWSQEVVEDES